MLTHLLLSIFVLAGGALLALHIWRWWVQSADTASDECHVSPQTARRLRREEGRNAYRGVAWDWDRFLSQRHRDLTRR